MTGDESLQTTNATEERPNAWVRMRERWGVTSNLSVFLILVSFAAAGMSVLKVSRPIMDAILPPDAPRWLWWTLRVTIIPPVYEVMLLGYGTLLGQRAFFWGKLKKLGMRIFRRSGNRTAGESPAGTP